MTKKRSTKRALLLSTLSLLLCTTMLIGSTFAWFTDSVTSSGNIIQSGKLDVAMEWKDATATGKQQTYQDASQGAIFNYEKWEPGYVEAKNIVISNKGNLALKYQLNILAEGAVSKLSDVIDVYYAKEEITLTSREMSGLTRVGTLTEVLAGMPNNMSGDLLDKKSDNVTIALKMQETAGNEYQGLGIGTDFSVQLMATQLTSEYDSFDNQYDVNAAFSVWDGTIPTEMPSTLIVDPTTRTLTINDASAFAYLHTLDDVWVNLYSNGQGTSYSNYAVENGGKGTDYYYSWGWDIKLNCDIDLANKAWAPLDIDFFSDFDGQGHTIKNISVSAVDNNAGLFANIRDGISNLTVDNVSINAGSYTSVGAVSGSANGKINNINVKNAIVTGNKYVGGIIGYGYASIINSSVCDSVITISDGGAKEAGGLAGYLCTTAEGEVKSNRVTNTVISAPTVASALVSQPNGNYDISNNIVKAVTVTTSDDTADIFVSNNVNGKSTVLDNTNIDCTINRAGTLTKVAFPATTADTKTALKNGANYIDAQGAQLDFNYMLKSSDVAAGETVTIKNAIVFGSNYGNAVAGTVVFENCTFTNTGAYSIHFDAGNGYVVFNNCTLEGWCSFGTAIKGVTMNNCKILGNGKYALVRFYQDATMNNCVFNSSNTDTADVYPDGIDMVEGYTATMINCTNLNGSVADLFEAADIDGTDGKVIIK